MTDLTNVEGDGAGAVPPLEAPYDPPAAEEPKPDTPVEQQHPDDAERPLTEPVVVDDEEVLEPKSLPIERVITDVRGSTRTYVQGPMLYFQKIELYGVLGRAVKIVMDGEGGLGIDDLMDLRQPQNLLDQLQSRMPGYDDAPDREDNGEAGLEEAGKMLAAFARVVSVAPDLLKEAYCIVLDIPKGHRVWAMEWGLPRIDDEMGLDILHAFLDQNWGVMEDFFVKEMPKLFRRAAKVRQRSASDQSKP
jgi:hypothetical protein